MNNGGEGIGIVVGAVLAVMVVTFLIGVMSGGNFENKRIYENCLKNNSTMTYADLNKMCKDIVK